MSRLLVLVIPGLACKDGDKAPGGVDSGVLSACTDCQLTNDSNFNYSAALEAAVVPVASARDVAVDWSDLELDIHGHVRGERFEVEQARLVAFHDLSPQQVLVGLATDTMDQSAVALYATCTPSAERCMLSEFSVFGRTFEIDRYFLEGSGTWLVILTSSAEAGGHAFVFLEPRNSENVDVVKVDDETSRLLVDVDLRSLQPIRPEIAAGTTLDWSELSQDGLGNPVALHQLDRLVLGRYPGLSVAELEERVFDLEALAEPLWIADVSGRTSISLEEVADGGALPAPDGASTLLALYCSSCLNPAPRFVTLLKDAP